MLEDAYQAAHVFGDSLLLLDRYFLIVPARGKLKSINSSMEVHMGIITKAKKSCTAYEKPGVRKHGRGRPLKKGAAVHLKDLFATHTAEFWEAEMELYGKKTPICYNSIDLLRGQKLYKVLWFVLVETDRVHSILASTSLALEPLAIIWLYSYRFRIECTFWKLKQQVGAFCYCFLSK